MIPFIVFDAPSSVQGGVHGQHFCTLTFQQRAYFRKIAAEGLIIETIICIHYGYSHFICFLF